MQSNIEVVAEDRDTYYMNMGPQHPSTHGVLRLKLHLEGETILSAVHSEYRLRFADLDW